MKALIVIPARYESQRLPGKVLLKGGGKPIVQWVYERAQECRLAEKVVVGTDSEEVLEAVEEFGGEAVMTSPDHRSGTERVAEVAQKFPSFPLVINIQGDEPEMPAGHVETLIRFLSSNSSFQVATLAAAMKDRREMEDVNNVKVVTDLNRRALYFSRSLIPYPRKEVPSQPIYRHIGIYAFWRDFLLKIVRLEPTPLEKTESLEQLRILENGYHIGVEVVDSIPPGIDTEEDYQAFLERLKNEENS